MQSVPLTPDDRSRYEWQLGAAGFDEASQARLKGATALISRIGGVGGTLALHLAAAGIGKLILAHAGNLRPSDLNRQLLMSHSALGSSRIDQAVRKLHDLNPRLQIDAVADNLSAENAPRLVAQADVVASCAPLFEERLAMNRAAVALGKPLVDCAMYEMEMQLLTVRPGQTACLHCLYSTPPTAWKREFPVFGAVAGTVASLGALEVIKLLTGVGKPLDQYMLIGDLASMTFRKIQVNRDPNCPTCRMSAAR